MLTATSAPTASPPFCALAPAPQAKLAALVDALSKIAHPTYGTEIHDTDSERADIYWQHIERFQRTAQQALVAAQVQP